jgi:hypothetical protein
MILQPPLSGRAAPEGKQERALLETHARYREQALTHRRFRHRDLSTLLTSLAGVSDFEVSLAGHSVEGREISLVKFGLGPTKVLLWSQMHGDEATATMALFDLFNFFQAQDEFDFLRNHIRQHLTLYFVPMLNPDGAERQTRRNALDIDLNRDALALQSPEAKLLKDLRNWLQPSFGFNLHDMNPLYSVGDSGVPAALSFLAPPADQERSVPEVRARAMGLIGLLNRRLQPIIPGRIAKWFDEFEPRAFGDNFQKWGTSVILLESGGYPDDPEKQYLRQLNFVALLTGLEAIALETYGEEENLWLYDQIPQNGPLLFDLIVRNVSVRQDARTYQTDLGIVRAEVRVPGQEAVYFRASLDDMGDLSVFSAYEEYDGQGLWLEEGKEYPVPFATQAEVATADLFHLLRQGYLFVRVEEEANGALCLPLPINLLIGKVVLDASIQFEGAANFLLVEGEEPRLAVVNGFVYNLQEPLERVYNGQVYF